MNQELEIKLRELKIEKNEAEIEKLKKEYDKGLNEMSNEEKERLIYFTIKQILAKDNVDRNALITLLVRECNKYG